EGVLLGPDWVDPNQSLHLSVLKSRDDRIACGALLFCGDRVLQVEDGNIAGCYRPLVAVRAVRRHEQSGDRRLDAAAPLFWSSHGSAGRAEGGRDDVTSGK